ncbi:MULTISPECIES: GntR family transcriptional regulator [Streptosporangium]|uniref:DNA-binding GntR family transcriptional regulator n=1 Tax=Streptosporangium brasiliense TaxID=47480 RepID=A0ABT9R1M4_9ACTN|nr:UTRA domain-containing protein [Streptosporangium brasiliense]MDP9863128.1 DNA-binding GntR family transcriptional regulator [Streptosporangium brasiliense]
MDDTTLEDITAIADPVERAHAAGLAMAAQQDLVAGLARLRREAVAEARASGVRQEAIARRLGVTPGRVSQMRPAGAREAVDGPAGPPRGPRVVVRRALPTEPAVRGSASLFMTEADRQGIRAGRRMLYVGPEPASGHVAAALRVEPGTEVLARRKLLLADDVPVRIATSFFRLDLFGGTPIAAPDFVRPSLQAGIEALGHRFGHAEEHLVARPPAGAEAGTLQLDPGEWVVQVLRAGYGDDGTPVHTLETICAASRHVFPIAQVTGADEF